MSAPDPLDRLPGPLPPGERLLWHGRPSARALARHLFRVRTVALYFVLLGLWPVSAALLAGTPPVVALLGFLVPLPLALPALGLLAAAAWATARTTTWYLTERRLILQIGVGLTRTVNVPLRAIVHAEVREHRDGSTDIALTLRPGSGMRYLALWPHARAWRFSEPQPMLRGLRPGSGFEDRLGAALMRAAPGVLYGRPEPAPARPPGLPAGA